jgi:hypothetical protein
MNSERIRENEKQNEKPVRNGLVSDVAPEPPLHIDDTCRTQRHRSLLWRRFFVRYIVHTSTESLCPNLIINNKSMFLFCCLIAGIYAKVIINEIYYADSMFGVEFVELHNTNMTGSESLMGWSISGGIDYTFGDTASIPPGGFIVIVENVMLYFSHFMCFCLVRFVACEPAPGFVKLPRNAMFNSDSLARDRLRRLTGNFRAYRMSLVRTLVAYRGLWIRLRKFLCAVEPSLLQPIRKFFFAVYVLIDFLICSVNKATGSTTKMKYKFGFPFPAPSAATHSIQLVAPDVRLKRPAFR